MTSDDQSIVPREVVHGLWLNLGRIRAQQTILHGNFNPLNPEQMRRLYWRAYESTEIAEAAELASLKALVDSKCPIDKTGMES